MMYFVYILDESMNEGVPNEGDYDDASSEGSEFVGSLGIEVIQGTWESDLRVQLDLQLGRDEWKSSFSAIEGGIYYAFPLFFPSCSNDVVWTLK